MLGVLLIDSVAFRLSSLFTGKMSSRGRCRIPAKKTRSFQKNTLLNFVTTSESVLSIARAILNDIMDDTVGIANSSKKRKHVRDKLQEKNWESLVVGKLLVNQRKR